MLSLVACSASEDSGSMNGGSSYGDGLVIDGISGDSADKGGIGGFFDSIFGDKSESADAPSESPEFDSSMGEGLGDSSTSNGQTGAGILTAGEWKDLDNIDFWKNVLNKNDWYSLMEQRNLFTKNIVSVKVLDNNKNPCFNIPVELTNEQGNTIYKSVTDVNGNAYLLYNLTNNGEQPGKIKVRDLDIEPVLDGVTTIILDAASSPTKLDLLFMVDTTGSMGDELRYLQTELRDVIRKVSQSNQELSINLSVNFYRDTGDEYIVRSFEFTNDIEKAIEDLNKQQSDGGGDYPEAVHTALKDIVFNHQWRHDSVKLCFMVLDAPPHTEKDVANINNDITSYVKSMSEKGIRFIPLASSGVNTETEFLLRSWAVMTGGTYTFLTDHSGIGNSHLEPTIGDYEVEKLNDLMVRIIKEYCGIISENP
jgi:hypothetical protein